MKLKQSLVLLTSIILNSCVDYTEPVYPLISGQYVVSHINVTYTNNFTNTDSSFTVDQGVFCLNDPIEPLDCIEIGTEKFEFDYTYFYAGFNMDNGSPGWDYDFGYRFIRDPFTHEYKYIDIDYDPMGNSVTKRVFMIIDWGAEYLTLRSSGQWAGASPEGDHIEFTMYMVN
jgi:hypothetical protein